MRSSVALLGLVAATSSPAEVVDRSRAGFEVRHEVMIGASPQQVYSRLLEPSRWWNPAHSYSGDAANLSIDLATGCFCERLRGGGLARHLQVIYSDGRRLVLSGALGPISTTGATEHMIIEVKEAGERTRLTLTYAVGGYARGGLTERWAAPVDAVLKEQVERLRASVEAEKGKR